MAATARRWLASLRRRPQFGIPLKLALALATFGMLASGLTGYYLFQATRATLAKNAGEDLLLSTQVLGRRFTVAVNAIATDARFMANLPGARNNLGNAEGAARSHLRSDLAEQFGAMLSVHPEYFQMRLIGARDHGRELVRVDRDGPALRRVEGVNLQEKGHFPYVFNTLQLAAGQVLYSKIFINRETGAHAGYDKPTLQVATPIVGAEGALGVIVINVDLNRLFELLKTDLAPAYQLFLANREGDYLIHPNPEKAFGFEQGRHFLMQDDFAPVAAIVDSGADSAMLGAGPDQRGADVIGSFARIPFGEVGSGRFVVLGLTVPLGAVLDGAENVAENTRRIVIALSALALLLSILVARAFVRPLDQLLAAVEHFSRTHQLQPLPTRRNDELGLLARSVNKMQEHLLAHLNMINQRKDAMEHQATHDALTGAPNRVMFYDLLRFAIRNARRGGGELALLFIDLDHFKQVNDNCGHAAGDAVLVAVVTRMQQAMRANDVVARLA
ncbi:MAG: diguanylate cyclase, partial [Burkholderiaceae bacterium]|nr:diguanylate cyclase [Burkholderiaceae bacterium]